MYIVATSTVIDKLDRVLMYHSRMQPVLWKQLGQSGYFLSLMFLARRDLVIRANVRSSLVHSNKSVPYRTMYPRWPEWVKASVYTSPPHPHQSAFPSINAPKHPKYTPKTQNRVRRTAAYRSFVFFNFSPESRVKGTPDRGRPTLVVPHGLMPQSFPIDGPGSESRTLSAPACVPLCTYP